MQVCLAVYLASIRNRRLDAQSSGRFARRVGDAAHRLAPVACGDP
jgi:hypothetical protein